MKSPVLDAKAACNEGCQAGWLYQQKCIVSQFGKLKVRKCCVGRVSHTAEDCGEGAIPGLSQGLEDILLLLVSSCLLPSMQIWAQILLSYKDTSYIELGTTLMTSF